MSDDERTHWTEAELLATHTLAEPLVARGRRCHGGFDADGDYVSPRTRYRTPAIRAWQAQHRRDSGAALLDAPIDTWPEPYPNLDQARFLLREGVRDPIVTTLTRIGTVEGFGAMLRHVQPGDLQPRFVESIDGTAIQHLGRGLFEAHARDEAGWEDEAGHKDMWFVARDVAFDDPVTADETAEMLARMGLGGGGTPDRSSIVERMLELRTFDDLDLGLEMLIRQMLSVLFIEIQAFHIFRWAESLLAEDLVAGDGEAARIIAYVRADETPHVEYLRTSLSEMHARTFVGESGRHLPGSRVIDTLWDRALTESLTVRREAQLALSLAEVERAVHQRAQRDDLLEEFHALGTIRPGRDGRFETVVSN